MAGKRTTACANQDKTHVNLYVEKNVFEPMFSAANKLNVSKSFVVDAVFERLCAGLTEEKVVEIILSQMAARAKGA